MLSTTRSKAAFLLSRRVQVISRRTFSTSDTQEISTSNSHKEVVNVSKTNEVPIEQHAHDGALQESAPKAEKLRTSQAPNRLNVWSRSQNPRGNAMTGPRFEQTIMELQPAPQAAIELIHKQPVRWTKARMVSCDGGGGPLGHPQIFINVDKPQICTCTYCGLPYANESHRKHLESLPSTSYPLEGLSDPAEVPESQRITDEVLGQR